MKKFLFSLLFASLFLFGCDDKTAETANMNAYVNEWLHENMSAYYYWNSSLPVYRRATDLPSTYFETLIYKDDRFSAIFDDYQTILNELNGVRASEAGFEFQLYKESDINENVMGIVLYVKPGTNAATLGIKRGDIFRKIDGVQINTTNYSSLINALYNSTSSVGLTFSTYQNNIFSDKSPISVIKVTDYRENPVYLDTIYTVKNKKVAYLVYNFFTNDPGDNTLKYDLELNDVFAKFKQGNITELIVDLRYNHGGMMTSAVNLASMLVPNLAANKVFSYTDYNRNFTDYFNSADFKKQNTDDPFVTNFSLAINTTVPKVEAVSIQNVGASLQRIFFITGKGTASASEMVINGLKPFLPCVLVGDTTVGKNVGSTLLNDEQNAKNKWAFMPIILKYFNKDHQSDFTKGFAPDFLVKDDYSYALGDTREALLAKAISQITGSQLSGSNQAPSMRLKLGNTLHFKTEKNYLVLRNKAIESYFKKSNK